VNTSRPVIVVGATPAGLLAATILARAGVLVRVLDERATADARSVHVRKVEIELEPELLFPRAPFDSALRASGIEVDDVVTFERVSTLARFFLPGAITLDWNSDASTNELTLSKILGGDAARAYRMLVSDAQDVLQIHRARIWSLDRPGVREILRAGFRQGPSFVARSLGMRSLSDEIRTRFSEIIAETVFERYARMLGSDPRRVPATALLLHAAELEGTYAIRGGTRGLVQGLERAALRAGAHFSYGAKGLRIVAQEGALVGVETLAGRVDAGALILASEAPIGGGESAPRSPERASASMVEWAFLGSVGGRPIARETWFASYSPAEELDDVFVRRILPRNPTLRLLHLDGDGDTGTPPGGARRFVLSVQVPSDPRASSEEELETLQRRAFERLHEAGLVSRMGAVARLDPRDFIGMSPYARDGMFGPNAHGVFAPFARDATTHQVSGVFNANKRTHPGPILSMQLAAGQRAAEAVLARLRLR
jgi:1-hydroxycarotenoid 3,4-desaturase